MDSLQHYSSPYYDPVKAHEYYEAHKKLKGRTSTAGLNEEGRKVASYVKKRITSEKKSRLDSNMQSRKSQIESRRSVRDRDVETHKAQMNQRIDSLRSTLKNMSKEDRAKNREAIQNEIASLRAENRAKREELSAEYKKDAEGIYSSHKTKAEKIRKEADDKYALELDKIKSEDEYTTKKSGSKTSKEELDKFIVANLKALKKK